MSLRKLYMDCANFKGMQRQRQTMLHGFFSGQGLFHRRTAHGSGIIRQGQRRAGAGAPALVQAQNQAGAILGFLHGLQHDIGGIYAELAVRGGQCARGLGSHGQGQRRGVQVVPGGDDPALPPVAQVG